MAIMIPNLERKNAITGFKSLVKDARAMSLSNSKIAANELARFMGNSRNRGFSQKFFSFRLENFVSLALCREFWGTKVWTGTTSKGILYPSRIVE